MDIKEVINNILHKHNQVKKPNDNSDSDQNYIKKEEHIQEAANDKNDEGELYQDFENNFNDIVNDLPPDYWRRNFEKKSKNVKKAKPQISKKGKFYLHYGMRINLKKNSEEANAIKELMHIIRQSHTQNDIFDKMADIKIQENKIINSKESGLISMIKQTSSSDSSGSDDSNNQEREKEVTKEKKEEPKNINEHLRLEELYIQSVAVSLLAESDGSSSIAKEILHNGGLDAIKKMDVASLKVILDQLNHITPNEHGIEL